MERDRITNYVDARRGVARKLPPARPVYESCTEDNISKIVQYTLVLAERKFSGAHGLLESLL